MAALLKKRAFAEFSHVIQEEVKPIKKLRLVQKPPPTEVQLNLQSAISSHETLQILLKFEERLPLDAGCLGGVVREMLDHFHREKEAVVRAKIATLLSLVAKLPNISGAGMVEDVISLLKTEKSHKVISHLISTLMVLGKCSPGHNDLHTQLVGVAQQHLKDSSHLTRSSCLELIGHLGLLEGADSQSGAFVPILRLLTDYTQDQDPRVRGSAFQAVLQLHQRGLRLSQDIYQHGCDALKDDYEGVRVAAVKLVWVLSHLFPECSVSVSDTEDIRLVDDGFAKICNMMNDISLKVRVQAASLLGSLHQVSQKFLEQTMDKKLISNMRRKRSAAERAREHFQSGEWSTGQKWADDAPKEEVEAESINLMNIGACGAFIHGLEDEFLEVRNAALDSLCELAAHSPGFANYSQDSIIDMFNDEIESVRLNAINSLRKLSQHIVIREDQLEIILGVLQDFSFTTREDLRDMLSDMKLATKECLRSCVMELLANLRRYPQDRISVWKCMKHLGTHHTHLTMPMVPELLCLHPYFDTPEPDMDDPAYISILVLLFNAAAVTPTMLPLFQDYIWGHYRYLRNSLPEHVPVLRVPGSREVMTEIAEQQTCDAADFLQRSLQQLSHLNTMDVSTAQQLLEVTSRDLKQICEVDTKVSASAECLCLFLQSQLMVTQLLSKKNMLLSNSAFGANINSTVEKILSLTKRLKVAFLGLGTQELSLIRQTELKALAFQLGMVNHTQHDRLQMEEQFLTQLKTLQKFLSVNEITPDAFTAYILSELDNIDVRNPTSFQRVLQVGFSHVKPSVLKVASHIRKAAAVIHEPTGVSDNPIKFTAGLASAVAVEATVENVENIGNVRLLVCYPDMKRELVCPKSQDFRKLSPLRHRLISQVLLSHQLWTDSCNVEISMVLLPSDIDQSTSETDQAVSLCKPVKVLVAPKAVKR